MKTIKVFICIALMVLVGTSLAHAGIFTKKQAQQGIYLFGVSASFTDSTVYFTRVQYLPEAVVTQHDLLEGRAQYSQQLKDYLETDKSQANRTCFVFYGRKEADVKKKWVRVQNKYLKNQQTKVKQVEDDFTFKPAKAAE